MESIHEPPIKEAEEHPPAPPPKADGASLQRAACREGMTPETVLRLQAGAGNAAVTAMLRKRAGAEPQGAAAQPAAPTTGAPKRAVNRSLFSAIGGFVKKAGRGIAGAASAAWSGVTGIAKKVLEGAKALGSTVVKWVKSAGSTVLKAISWFGDKAWDVIKAIGTFAFEKLALLGALAWSFISKLPVRFWRLLVDGWEGFRGVLGWLWTGLKGAAAGVWGAVAGVFRWLGDGLAGALRWLGEGLAKGAAWALDFIASPSLDKLVNGLLGTLSWLGDGVKGLARWGWDGVVAAAKWARSGIKALGTWLWDGVLGGLKWCGLVLLHLFEILGGGEALQLLWGLLFRLRPLTGPEIAASQSVHPSGLIPYSQIRVDENSYLIKIGTALAELVGTKTKPGAITTMHIIHAPSGMSLSLAVHELTHVAQYEKVGAVYMPQALHGQGSAAGYNYGDLTAARAAGKTFSDFNREQQASICEDYYLVKNGQAAEFGGTEASLAPFIEDMRAGAF